MNECQLSAPAPESTCIARYRRPEARVRLDFIGKARATCRDTRWLWREAERDDGRANRDLLQVHADHVKHPERHRQGERDGDVNGRAGAGDAVNPSAPAVLLFAALAAYAITSGACNFIEIIYPNELFPTAVRATATGTVVAISRVGSAVSTFVLPLVLTGTGLAGVMWLLAGVNIAGLVATLGLGEETRGRALSDTSAASPESCSGRIWGWVSRAAMRISVSSFRTTREDVERSTAAILEAAATVSGSLR